MTQDRVTNTQKWRKNEAFFVNLNVNTLLCTIQNSRHFRVQNSTR